MPSMAGMPSCLQNLANSKAGMGLKHQPMTDCLIRPLVTAGPRLSGVAVLSSPNRLGASVRPAELTRLDLRKDRREFFMGQIIAKSSDSVRTCQFNWRQI